MTRFLMVASLVAVGSSGCGRSPPNAAPHPGRKVTWGEYQKLDAEQKTDPYILDNLDDAARQKLAGIPHTNK